MLLCGCKSTDSDLNTALSLRENLSRECTFLIEITADYGDSVYTFQLDCRSNADGSLNFTVERSGKSLIGSAASGEGLVNVYRGTGKVLMAPLTRAFG